MPTLPVSKCYLYGVFGPNGSGGIDLLKVQTFSSESATVFGVPENSLLVLLRTTVGDDYGDAYDAMMKTLDYASFPEPYLSKIRYFLRSEIASRAGRQAWMDLYDRDHFEGKYAVKSFVPATPTAAAVADPAIGCRVRHSVSRSLQGVVTGIARNLYTVMWDAPTSCSNVYTLDDLEFLEAPSLPVPKFKIGDRVDHNLVPHLRNGEVLEVRQGRYSYKVAWPGHGIDSHAGKFLDPVALPVFEYGDCVDLVNGSERGGNVTAVLESMPEQYDVTWMTGSEGSYGGTELKLTEFKVGDKVEHTVACSRLDNTPLRGEVTGFELAGGNRVKVAWENYEFVHSTERVIDLRLRDPGIVVGSSVVHATANIRGFVTAINGDTYIVGWDFLGKGTKNKLSDLKLAPPSNAHITTQRSERRNPWYK